MKRLSWVVLWGLLLAGAGGCHNSCQELAQEACQRQGEQTQQCKTQQDYSSNAGARSTRLCERALMLLRSLEQN